MAVKFTNLKKKTGIKEADMNLNRHIPTNIVIKMTKVKGKERILKVARESQRVNYEGSPMKLSADFSTEIS